MYADIIEAIDKGLYEGETGIFVVDTHSKGEFHADISVAHQEAAHIVTFYITLIKTALLLSL